MRRDFQMRAVNIWPLRKLAREYLRLTAMRVLGIRIERRWVCGPAIRNWIKDREDLWGTPITRVALRKSGQKVRFSHSLVLRADHSIYQGLLDGDQELVVWERALLFKKGTWLHFHESGSIEKGTLASELAIEIRGIPCRLSHGSEIGFHPDGRLNFCRIESVEFPGGDEAPALCAGRYIYFEPDGSIARDEIICRQLYSPIVF